MVTSNTQPSVDSPGLETYLEHYLDSVENLPNELQLKISDLREHDCHFSEILDEISGHHEVYMQSEDANVRHRELMQIQKLLIMCQEIGDEKIGVVAQIMEAIDSYSKQLESDYDSLDNPSNGESSVSLAHPSSKLEEYNFPSSSVSAIQSGSFGSAALTRAAAASRTDSDKSNDSGSSQKGGLTSVTQRQRRRMDLSGSVTHVDDSKQDDVNNSNRSRKRRRLQNTPTNSTSNVASSQQSAGTSSTLTKREAKKALQIIDNDEPLYCVCRQISYGEMIGCDNRDCDVEWFHFSCVGLTHKPKGRWYCPGCRGDKPTAMRKKT